MLGLIFGNAPTTKFGNSYGNIEIDAVMEEEHNWQSQTTSNPVENGAPVTDHVIQQNDTVRIKGFLSDSPITMLQAVKGLTTEGSRTQTTFDILRDLQLSKEVVTIYTKHAVYSDMIVTSVKVPRSKDTGNGIEFHCEFQKVVFVEIETVDVPDGVSKKKTAKGDKATANKTESQKDAGKKQAETKPSSMLSRIF